MVSHSSSNHTRSCHRTPERERGGCKSIPRTPNSHCPASAGSKKEATRRVWGRFDLSKQKRRMVRGVPARTRRKSTRRVASEQEGDAWRAEMKRQPDEQHIDIATAQTLFVTYADSFVGALRKQKPSTFTVDQQVRELDGG